MLQSLYIISSSSKIITFITLFPTTILYSSLWTYESFMLQPLDIILSYSRTTKFVTLFPTAILCSRLWLFTYYFYMSSLSGGFRNFIHCDHYENLNYTKFNSKKKNHILTKTHTHTHTHTHTQIHKMLQFPYISFLILISSHNSLHLFQNFSSINFFLGLFLFICKGLIYC